MAFFLFLLLVANSFGFCLFIFQIPNYAIFWSKFPFSFSKLSAVPLFGIIVTLSAVMVMLLMCNLSKVMKAKAIMGKVMKIIVMKVKTIISNEIKVIVMKVKVMMCNVMEIIVMKGKVIQVKVTQVKVIIILVLIVNCGSYALLYRVLACALACGLPMRQLSQIPIDFLCLSPNCAPFDLSFAKFSLLFVGLLFFLRYGSFYSLTQL